MPLVANRFCPAHFLPRSLKCARIPNNAPISWRSSYRCGGAPSLSGCIGVPLVCESCGLPERGVDGSMDTTWHDMPLHDGESAPARISVLVETRVWRKIGEKHMANPREPWREWLGSSLASTFQALWPRGCQTDDE